MPWTASTVRSGGASGAPYRKVARVPPSTSTGTGVGALAGEPTGDEVMDPIMPGERACGARGPRVGRKNRPARSCGQVHGGVRSTR